MVRLLISSCMDGQALRKGFGVMELLEMAREYKENIDLGLDWIIIWKAGEDWKAFRVCLTGRNMLVAEDFEMAKYILSQDENAIILNGAHFEDMSEEKIASDIEIYYRTDGNLLRDWDDFVDEDMTPSKPGEIVRAMLDGCMDLCEAGLDKGDASKYTAVEVRLSRAMALIKELERGMR